MGIGIRQMKIHMKTMASLRKFEGQSCLLCHDRWEQVQRSLDASIFYASRFTFTSQVMSVHVGAFKDIKSD